MHVGNFTFDDLDANRAMVNIMHKSNVASFEVMHNR